MSLTATVAELQRVVGQLEDGAHEVDECGPGDRDELAREAHELAMRVRLVALALDPPEGGELGGTEPRA